LTAKKQRPKLANLNKIRQFLSGQSLADPHKIASSPAGKASLTPQNR
jgi:hypothetical protein